MRPAAALVGALALAAAARAEIVDLGATGFEVRETARIAAPAARVWAALGEIGAWWDSATHLFRRRGQPRHRTEGRRLLVREPAAHAAGAEHMRVVYVKPPFAVRLEGALGPLQTTGATGHMAWTLKEADGHTDFTLTYDVGGYAKGGFASWAKPVDAVLATQVGRLKRYVETGAVTRGTVPTASARVAKPSARSIAASSAGQAAAMPGPWYTIAV